MYSIIILFTYNIITITVLLFVTLITRTAVMEVSVYFFEAWTYHFDDSLSHLQMNILAATRTLQIITINI